VTGLEDAIVTVSSVVGSAAVVGAAGRRWFRGMVQDIVDDSIADVLRRQTEFERRQGKHLDRQDTRLERIERLVTERR
jgi:hypothetical protein